MQRQRHVQGSLPRPAELILLSLKSEPKHAIALRKEIEQAMAAGIEPGAFNRVLARLERRGWIDREHAERQLHRYHITALGLLALERTGNTRQRQQAQDEWNPASNRRKGRTMRLVIWMLRFYPPTWRERYETEMIALLEQHTLTLWTVIDLLFGALDTRLDPYYRSQRQLTPWRGLRDSWRLMLTAFVTFGLTLILLVNQGASSGPFALNWPSFADPSGLFGTLVYLCLPLVITALVGWIGWQAGKNVWNLLRLLPVALFVQLLYLPSWIERYTAWLNQFPYFAILGVFLLSLVFTASNIGTMLIACKRWGKRTRPLFSFGARLLVLLALAGMVLLCFINLQLPEALWMGTQQAVDPLSQTIGVTIEFAMLLLTTLLALIMLVRSLFALKTMRIGFSQQALPRQESSSLPSKQEQSQEFQRTDPSSTSNETSARTLPGVRTNPMAWIIIAPVLLFVLVTSFMMMASATIYTTSNLNIALHLPSLDTDVFLLMACLACALIALVVRKSTKKMPEPREQETLLQQVQVIRQP